MLICYHNLMYLNIVKYLYFIMILHKSHELHTQGIWNTDNEFFHFIAKFGFQKTNQHEIEISEGYLFGNITTVSDNELNSNKNSSAVLVLLPEKYFLHFYQNRSLQLHRSADEACQIMFKEIDKEAYDVNCHDTGREDFLRKVPCPKGFLCVDEDNPINVIPNMQLTYAIQDISNPRFWFLTMVACQRNVSCMWEHTKQPLKMHYDLTLVNGKPFVHLTNLFEYHFSFEQQDTVEIYVICLLYYSCILVPIQVYAAYKQVHPITRLFTAILLIQLSGLLFDSVHLLVYSFDGAGLEGLILIGDVLNIIAQSLFMILLLLLARGWAITRMILTRKHLLICLWASYSVLIFVLYFWNKNEVDVIEDIDEYQTWPGWLTLFLRVVIMFWFLLELRNTMQYEHNAAKLQFFLQFGAASLVWFIYMPLVALIALQIYPLWRYKVILGFTYFADMLAHSFMAYMLWPQRSEQYLLLANEEDLSEELAAFDEAPHIVNHEASEVDFYSSSHHIDSSSTESLVLAL